MTDPLWRYVERAARSSRPLRIAGLDTQITGQRSLDILPATMARAFAALPGVTPADAARAAEAIPLVQTRLLATLQPAEREHLAGLLDRLARHAGADTFLRQTARTML